MAIFILHINQLFYQIVGTIVSRVIIAYTYQQCEKYKLQQKKSDITQLNFQLSDEKL